MSKPLSTDDGEESSDAVTPTPAATSATVRAEERPSQPLASSRPPTPLIITDHPPTLRHPTFLDRLFTALTTLPADGNLDAGVEAILDVFADAHRDVEAGACVVRPEGIPHTVVFATNGTRPASSDPTRLFPDLEEERIVELGRGSTLHLASRDPSSLRSADDAIERLAAALRSLIEQSFVVNALRETRRVHDERSRESEELRLRVAHSEKLASLGQIAARVVHELNNPLTSIIAYSDYLKKRWRRTETDAADLVRLERISEAAERILSFSRDLIAYSRPSASVPGPVSIHDVLSRSLMFCEHTMTVANVEVEQRFGDVRPISGVPGALTQVFVNLVTNACQAMRDAGGQLIITTEHGEDDATVLIHIEDVGGGIAEGDIERIFDPYFTTKSDGTGLGLPIVRDIVENHGGSIHAKNGERGAIFTVELPVCIDSTG